MWFVLVELVPIEKLWVLITLVPLDGVNGLLVPVVLTPTEILPTEGVPVES